MRLGHLDAPSRDRLMRFVGLTARPDLTPAQAESAQAMVRSPTWEPLPRLPALYHLEPLLRHHAIDLGFEPEQVMVQEGGGLKEPLSFYQAAAQYYERQRVLQQLLEEFHKDGVGPVILVKGAALSPYFPSPALRFMSDFDFIIRPEQSERVQDLLASLGWLYTANSWASRNGISLDLLEGSNAFSEEICAAARPHPSYPADWQVLQPDPAHHLLMLAIHAQQHGGARIWRDVCDAALFVALPSPLLGPAATPGDVSRLAERAMELAARHQAAVSLAAFFRFLNAHCHPSAPLPEQAPQWSTGEETSCAGLLRLYGELASDRASLLAFDYMTSLLALPRSLWHYGCTWVGTAFGRREISHPPRLPGYSGAQTDPLIGAVLVGAPVRRQLMKLRVGLSALMTRNPLRYWNLVRLRNSLPAQPKPFAAAAVKPRRR